MKASRLAIIHLVAMLSLTACIVKNKPDPTDRGVVMETVISTLSGIVLTSGKTIEPFVTPIELRGKDTLWLYKSVIPDVDGRFEIRDIPPGDYELWVLIITAAKMVSGCEDIWVPNNQWRIGIKFQENDPIMMEETSLQKAISRSQNFTAYDLQPTGFYAISPDFTIVSVFDEDIDVTLSCK